MDHDHVSAQPQSHPPSDAKWARGKVAATLLGAIISFYLLRQTWQRVLNALRPRAAALPGA